MMRRLCNTTGALSRYKNSTMAKIHSGPYAAAWRGYRRRDRWVRVTLLGFPLGGVLLGMLLNRLFNAELLPWSVLGWAGLVVVTTHRARALPCPRCGASFYSSRLSYNMLARRCMHCGLPKWAPSDPDQPA